MGNVFNRELACDVIFFCFMIIYSPLEKYKIMKKKIATDCQKFRNKVDSCFRRKSIKVPTLLGKDSKSRLIAKFFPAIDLELQKSNPKCFIEYVLI